MQIVEHVDYGHFYHIYNRGVDSCNLFREPDNYGYFLALYDKYISPVADTYAWVLMPNHFHLLVKVKEENEIGFIPRKTLSEKTLSGETLSGYETAERAVVNPDGGYPEKKYKHVNQFSHLFNSYAQAFNKRFERTGCLFQHPFKRKLISSESYLRHVILYIHNNPVHHSFCSHPVEYPWSSYLTCVSIKPTKLQRDSVVGWFDNQVHFKLLHQQQLDIEGIEKWLEL